MNRKSVPPSSSSLSSVRNVEAVHRCDSQSNLNLGESNSSENCSYCSRRRKQFKSRIATGIYIDKCINPSVTELHINIKEDCYNEEHLNQSKCINVYPSALAGQNIMTEYEPNISSYKFDIHTSSPIPFQRNSSALNTTCEEVLSLRDNINQTMEPTKEFNESSEITVNNYLLGAFEMTSSGECNDAKKNISRQFSETGAFGKSLLQNADFVSETSSGSENEQENLSFGHFNEDTMPLQPVLVDTIPQNVDYVPEIFVHLTMQESANFDHNDLEVMTSQPVSDISEAEETREYYPQSYGSETSLPSKDIQEKTRFNGEIPAVIQSEHRSYISGTGDAKTCFLKDFECMPQNPLSSKYVQEDFSSGDNYLGIMPPQPISDTWRIEEHFPQSHIYETDANIGLEPTKPKSKADCGVNTSLVYCAHCKQDFFDEEHTNLLNCKETYTSWELESLESAKTSAGDSPCKTYFENTDQGLDEEEPPENSMSRHSSEYVRTSSIEVERASHTVQNLSEIDITAPVASSSYEVSLSSVRKRSTELQLLLEQPRIPRKRTRSISLEEGFFTLRSGRKVPKYT